MPLGAAASRAVGQINNNPFEFWITHDDAGYNQLMEDVQGFIDAPGDADLPVRAVFTPAMFDGLLGEMAAVGWAESLPELRAMWEDDYKVPPPNTQPTYCHGRPWEPREPRQAVQLCPRAPRRTGRSWPAS